MAPNYRDLINPGQGKVPASRQGVVQYGDARQWFGDLVDSLKNDDVVRRDLENGPDLQSLYVVNADGSITQPFADGAMPADKDGRNAKLQQLFENACEGRLMVRANGTDKFYQLSAMEDHGMQSTRSREPVEDFTMQMPEAPKFGFFTRLLAIFFPSIIKNKEAEFQQALRDYANVTVINDNMKKVKASVVDEVHAEADVLTEKKNTALKEMAVDKFLKESTIRPIMFAANEENVRTDKFHTTLDGLMGPKVHHPKFLLDRKVYQMEHYTVHDYSEFMRKRNNAGKDIISDRQMAVLGLLACASTEVNEKAQFKLEEGRTLEQQAEHNFSFIAEGFFLGDDRPNSDKFLGVMRQGRKQHREAIRAFDNGDPTKLGKLLADGIKATNKSIAATSSLGGKGKFGLYAELNEEMVALMEKNPAMKEAAMTAGLTQDELNIAKGTAAVGRLYREGLAARKEIAMAAARGKTLANREELLGKVFMMESLDSAVALHNHEAEEAFKETNEEMMKDYMKRINEMTNRGENPTELMNEMTRAANAKREATHADIVKTLGSDSGAAGKMMDKFRNSQEFKDMMALPMQEMAKKLGNSKEMKNLVNNASLPEKKAVVEGPVIAPVKKNEKVVQGGGFVKQ